jgi:carbamoyltransferase
LGPRFTSEEISRFLTSRGVEGQAFDEESDLLSRVAELLAEGKIVGWFQGAMEFGPRALGARSILGDPRSPETQATMNLKIKFRESFRPFAPSVLLDRVSDWFDLKPGQESPYMLLVAPVREEQRVPIREEDLRVMREDPDLRRRVNVVRSKIPAVTHVDDSARIQTVDAARNPRFARLLAEFENLTGCPVLVNTSFNVRGEPIVCTPEDAYRCFLVTEMDALVLENVLIMKDAIERQAGQAARAEFLSQFQLD